MRRKRRLNEEARGNRTRCKRGEAHGPVRVAHPASPEHREQPRPSTASSLAQAPRAAPSPPSPPGATGRNREQPRPGTASSLAQAPRAASPKHREQPRPSTASASIPRLHPLPERLGARTRARADTRRRTTRASGAPPPRAPGGAIHPCAATPVDSDISLTPPPPPIPPPYLPLPRKPRRVPARL